MIDKKLCDTITHLVNTYTFDGFFLGMVHPHKLLDAREKADRNCHRYKSLAGQPTIFIELERYFYHLSDEDFYALNEKVKDERLELLRHDDTVNYVDLDLFFDLLHMHISLRDFDNKFDMRTYIDIAKSYINNSKLGVELGLTDDILYQRIIEISKR